MTQSPTHAACSCHAAGHPLKKGARSSCNSRLSSCSLEATSTSRKLTLQLLVLSFLPAQLCMLEVPGMLIIALLNLIVILSLDLRTALERL